MLSDSLCAAPYGFKIKRRFLRACLNSLQNNIDEEHDIDFHAENTEILRRERKAALSLCSLRCAALDSSLRALREKIRLQAEIPYHKGD